jgi:hypothetical protein
MSDNVETLQRELQQEYSALSTQDCATACKALASIRRAADKICALEPGPRCADARAKADDAQHRVQSACPDCQIAAAPPTDEERRAAEQPAPGSAKPQAAPPAEDRRGGCASCSTPGDLPPFDLGGVLLAAFVLTRALRWRRSSRRS